ncbi:hypothetical protein IJV57_01255 [Candidatus Saccharibacteria bacterium]|nr:hypothetical protein [Candidatus Saccharibacteria bacterium]
MYDDNDVDSTFHIPVSSVIKAAVEEAEQKKQLIAPEVSAPVAATPVEAPQSPQTVSVAQTTPVQTVQVSSMVPVHYSAKATYEDKKLYKELSAVSDEVLACRNAILNNIF